MLDSLDTLIAFVVIMLVVSLLITIAVQIVSALFNLRGLNLAQGLKRTLAVIDPNGENAKKLANYILKGRFLSDSFLPDWPIFRWWRHAAAVRPKEVFDAIQRIAIEKEPGNYISLWGTVKSWLTNRKPVNLKENASSILKKLGVPEAAINSTRTAIAEGEQITKEFAEAAANNYQKFEYWACIGEERARQWMTMHTRILTVIFAATAAIALQLDSVAIFKLVSANKAVRDKLVAESAAVTSQAEKALGDSKSVLQTTYDSWLRTTESNVRNALTVIKVDPTETREKLEARIAAALPANVSKEDILRSFSRAVDDTVTDLLNDRARDYSAVRFDLDKTGFDLLPPKNWRWGEKWRDGWTSRHVVGVLFSIGLLSLGAPFWYNALKNLMSLRSQVAQNISAEQKQKPPDSASSPPPTVTIA
jgi:hypothetical protein